MRPIDADAVYPWYLEAFGSGEHGPKIEPKDIRFSMRDIKENLDNIPTIEMPHWVPCSERLPEYSGRYLVSVLDGIDRRTTVAPYHPQSRTWSLTGRMAYWKVIAWMPLPAPYEERQEE